jgi:mutator protein MutT
MVKIMKNEKFHGTVVAIFINNKKLLMEQRSKKRSVYAGFLMCPSGHMEENELPEAALKREMREELSISVIKCRFLFAIDDVDPFSKRKFRHNFMLIESFDGEIGVSKEAKELIWIDYDQLKKKKLAPIVRKLVEGLHELKIF